MITVRDLARQLPSAWQESLKAGGTDRLRCLPARAAGAGARRDKRAAPWIHLDPPTVASRWARRAPARPGPRRDRAAGRQPDDAAAGAVRPGPRRRPGPARAGGPASNSSLGRVQAEVLRRVNAELPEEVHRRYVYGDVVKRSFGARVLGAQERAADPGSRRRSGPGARRWPSGRSSSSRRAATRSRATLEDLRCADSAFTDEVQQGHREREVAAASVAALAAILANQGTRRASSGVPADPGRRGDGLLDAGPAPGTAPPGLRVADVTDAPITAVRSADSIAAAPARLTEGSPWARLCETDGLTEDQQEILKAVRTLRRREDPARSRRSSSTPTSTRRRSSTGSRSSGIFGLMIPEEYDGLGESLLTYALCVEEIARGWMSVSGVINTHFIVAYMLMQHGTEEQKKKYLPRMATGEVRGAFSMSEPGLGSDVVGDQDQGGQDDDGYEITGQKMWLTNGGTSTLVALLVKTDEGCGLGLQEHDDVPGGEGARLRRDRPGPHHPGQDRQDGLQGRRHHRGGLRGPPDLGRPDPRWRARQGLLPDDGRRRGRPRQRRRPRLRHRATAPSSSASPTPSSARPSASRSPSTRRSCSGSRRWRPRSRPPTR